MSTRRIFLLTVVAPKEKRGARSARMLTKLSVVMLRN